MKKKKKVKKTAVIPAAGAPPAALGTQKKKKTVTAKKTATASSAEQNLELLSNLDEESIFPRKAPPEDMPSYIPYSKQNAPRSTRAVPRQPPTLLYLPLLTQIDDDDCNALDHNSPHKDPSVEFVELAARAADPSDAMEDNDDDEEEEHISGGTFHDLVGGAKSSCLDDLGYSSVDDDEDYDDGMEEEARRIEYSDSNMVRPGRRQTNKIPGGPKPPSYNGMSATEMAFAKSEFKKVRKKYTDALRVKRLKENNEEYEPESFYGCLAIVL
jgi:hypothetical protein